MSTALAPYRQPGAIEVHEKVHVTKTGLIPYVPPPPPHRCDFPTKYVETVMEEKTFLFFFVRRKICKIEREVLTGSLYRCPECYEVAIFKRRPSSWSDPEWHINKEAAEKWLDKTGEFVDGES